MSEPSPSQPCGVCGQVIPEGHAVFTMSDFLTGPILALCRDCAALDDHLEDHGDNR